MVEKGLERGRLENIRTVYSYVCLFLLVVSQRIVNLLASFIIVILYTRKKQFRASVVAVFVRPTSIKDIITKLDSLCSFALAVLSNQ